MAGKGYVKQFQGYQFLQCLGVGMDFKPLKAEPRIASCSVRFRLSLEGQSILENLNPLRVGGERSVDSEPFLCLVHF